MECTGTSLKVLPSVRHFKAWCRHGCSSVKLPCYPCASTACQSSCPGEHTSSQLSHICVEPQTSTLHLGSDSQSSPQLELRACIVHMAGSLPGSRIHETEFSPAEQYSRADSDPVIQQEIPALQCTRPVTQAGYLGCEAPAIHISSNRNTWLIICPDMP